MAAIFWRLTRRVEHLRGEILSYSRTRGLFAGITLKGSTITADRNANERFYGYPYGSGQLVLEEEPAIPHSAAAVSTWQPLLSEEAPKTTNGEQ